MRSYVFGDAGLDAVWRKSSHSGADSNCVEVSDTWPGTVPVRDSKTPGGPRLAFGASAWVSFVAALKTDDGSGTAEPRF
ncbi:DUF397 domain-containing protein [Streptomyces sp. NPDC056987]|uniref:DUF397 domain-containing protein n=1 Tax=Streptomyces sp. NPDC056987 TaxID=3345988 RepID=UPI00362E4E8B